MLPFLLLKNQEAYWCSFGQRFLGNAVLLTGKQTVLYVQNWRDIDDGYCLKIYVLTDYVILIDLTLLVIRIPIKITNPRLN
jgi:hypothetical protein